MAVTVRPGTVTVTVRAAPVRAVVIVTGRSTVCDCTTVCVWPGLPSVTRLIVVRPVQDTVTVRPPVTVTTCSLDDGTATLRTSVTTRADPFTRWITVCWTVTSFWLEAYRQP